MILEQYNYLKAIYKRYERWLMPGMLVFGVLIDFITFQTIEIDTAFTIVVVYLILLAFLIFLQHQKFVTYRYIYLLLPYIQQFLFGALLSVSFIFYWFSGTLAASWLLIGIVSILMISNEVFRDYFQKPVFQVGVYYFILFSTFSLFAPFIFNSIESWVFVVGGVASLIAIYIYIAFAAKTTDVFEFGKYKMLTSVAGVFIFMNVLYFSNVIPPIPLSIRDAGVYHSITRSMGNYIVKAEKESIIDKIIPGQTIHVKEGNSIYLFSSIFAPTDLNTSIVHEWQYKQNGEWVTHSSPSYSLVGGRDAGYRGFSFSTIFTEGKWRVNVKTQRGQVLGRVNFNVEFVDELPEFEEEKK